MEVLQLRSNRSDLPWTQMDLKDELFYIRCFISIVGMGGNVTLIVSILQMSHLKTFEIFLLGFCASNLEEILIVDIYDIIIIWQKASNIGFWSCSTLRFLTVAGEMATIQFTVLICVFRYQKLSSAGSHMSLHIAMDDFHTAWTLSLISVFLALLLSTPTFFMDLDRHMENRTLHTVCPADVFQCSGVDCPLYNAIYKTTFLFLLILLPLLFITVTSCLIIRTLLIQKRSITQQLSEPEQQHHHQHHTLVRNSAFQRSMVEILAAMAIFQLAWMLYLVLHLNFDSYSFELWSEVEFYISTSYAALSPYVYGMGNNFCHKCVTCPLTLH